VRDVFPPYAVNREHSQQCCNHAAHNIIDGCIAICDHDVVNKAIQAARALKIHNEEKLITAMFMATCASSASHSATDFVMIITKLK
jgi:hypothetical protein